MVSYKGTFVNSDSTSKLDIVRGTGQLKLVISLQKLNELVTVNSFVVKGDKNGMRNSLRARL